jgi:hypothetical protein
LNLESEKILKILKLKGVKYLCHANTVTTAAAYLKNGKLLSRESVSKSGDYQTVQKSDEIDKKQGIFDYIFLDTVDIHNRARRRNEYGPVLFVFKLDLLSDSKFKKVRITKTNPIHWDGRESEDKRYYISSEDLENGFRFGDFDASLMFEDIQGLPLKDYLIGLILDDPKIKVNGLDLTENAENVLKASWKSGPLKNIKLDVVKRKCTKANCKCHWNYSTDIAWVNTSFLLRCD